MYVLRIFNDCREGYSRLKTGGETFSVAFKSFCCRRTRNRQQQQQPHVVCERNATLCENVRKNRFVLQLRTFTRVYSPNVEKTYFTGYGFGGTEDLIEETARAGRVETSIIFYVFKKKFPVSAAKKYCRDKRPVL